MSRIWMFFEIAFQVSRYVEGNLFIVGIIQANIH